MFKVKVKVKKLLVELGKEMCKDCEKMNCKECRKNFLLNELLGEMT